MQQVQHLGIVGSGLIGGSIARAAKAVGAAAKITIIEETGEKAAEALTLGLAEEAGVDLALLGGCDLIILATSVTFFEKLAEQLAPHLKPGAIVSDVASVKRAAIDAVRKHLPDHAHFIPGHPVAGTEHSGLKAGFAELFQHKWHILTPSNDADPQAVAALKAFWEKLGAHVAVMSADSHDAAFATTSHLPHAIAFSLMQAADDQAAMQGKDILKFAANSFGDYTRVAASDPGLWRDIFLNNREALLASLAAFNAKIAQVTHMLHINDTVALENFIANSRRARKDLDAFKEDGTKGF